MQNKRINVEGATHLQDNRLNDGKICFYIL